MAWPDELVEKPILLHAHQSHLYWSAAGDRIAGAAFSFRRVPRRSGRSLIDRPQRVAERGRPSVLYDAASPPRRRVGHSPFDGDAG